MPYARLDSPPETDKLAVDRTVSELVNFTGDPDEHTFVVFGKDGMLREMVLLVNAPLFPTAQQRFLDSFLGYRLSVGDDPVQLPEPTKESPRLGRVRHFEFVAFDPALDGTLSLLVAELGLIKAVLVIDADGEVVDRVHMEHVHETHETYANEMLHFVARRAEVGDPLLFGDSNEPQSSAAADRG